MTGLGWGDRRLRGQPSAFDERTVGGREPSGPAQADQGLLLVDATARSCRWIAGDPRELPVRVFQKTVEGASSWCAHHKSLVFEGR